jgi:hypothetical protein
MMRRGRHPVPKRQGLAPIIMHVCIRLLYCFRCQLQGLFSSDFDPTGTPWWHPFYGYQVVIPRSWLNSHGARSLRSDGTAHLAFFGSQCYCYVILAGKFLAGETRKEGER